MLTGMSQVKVKKFKQARVNGGSNYDSLKVRDQRKPPAPAQARC